MLAEFIRFAPPDLPNPRAIYRSGSMNGYAANAEKPSPRREAYLLFFAPWREHSYVSGCGDDATQLITTVDLTGM